LLLYVRLEVANLEACHTQVNRQSILDALTAEGGTQPVVVKCLSLSEFALYCSLVTVKKLYYCR